MKHLGERVTSLVDGQLGDNSRDLVLAHLARCDLCRDVVADERAVKAALQALPDVTPSHEFVSALHAIAQPGGPLPPQRRPFPETATAVAGWRTELPADDREPLTRRGVRIAAGTALSAGLLTVMLAALGAPTGGEAPSPLIQPEIERFTMEHARSAGSLPFLDPAAILVSGLPSGQQPVGFGR